MATETPYRIENVYSIALDAARNSSPSQELTKRMMGLPKGTKVAFASPNSTEVLQSNYSNLEIDHYRRTFGLGLDTHCEEELKKLCYESGLKVAYLADPETMEIWIKRGHQSNESIDRLKEEAKLCRPYHPGQRGFYTQVGRSYPEGYLWDVQRDYFTRYLPGQLMWPNVERLHPEVIIGSEDFIEPWMARDKLKGLLWKEETVKDTHRQPTHINELNFNGIANPQASVYRESFAHEYTAATKGYILASDANPHYRGYWKQGNRPLALCEYYIVRQEGAKVEGAVFDILGDACFQGIIDNQTVHFYKVCQPQTYYGAHNQPIEYQGEKDARGNYKGKFNSTGQSLSFTPGTFVIRKAED